MKNNKSVLQSRIRDIKRKLLHEHNPIIRETYRDHINYLQSQIG